MRIVLISDYYSEGMGHTENCLPSALAALGHEVHVVASNLNVYGLSSDYGKTYERFLGPAEQSCGTREIDGYTLHRLPYRPVAHYVRIRGLVRKVAELRPDVIQATAAAGINTFAIAMAMGRTKGRLFSECHQHMSVVHPKLKQGSPLSLRRGVFCATRTLPGRLTACVTQKCYAISPDCADVAHRFYGVPRAKIVLSSLGTDTELFHAASSPEDDAERAATRRKLAAQPSEIVCIYTGRLTAAKNPLLLAQAVAELRSEGLPYRSLFIGEGAQEKEIVGCDGSTTLPFVRHRELAQYYRAADIGVWPLEESMSMLDAAACGLPIVVNHEMGQPDRVDGNGLFYEAGSAHDLATALRRLNALETRRQLGVAGANKMQQAYSWTRVAERRLEDYSNSL